MKAIKGSHISCVIAILPTGPRPNEDKEIFLGSAFLRNFYSEFDLDDSTIGCKSAGFLGTK